MSEDLILKMLITMCGGLKRNAPSRQKHLNILFLVGGFGGGGLGNAVLQEEICHQGGL